MVGHWKKSVNRRTPPRRSFLQPKRIETSSLWTGEASLELQYTESFCLSPHPRRKGDPLLGSRFPPSSADDASKKERNLRDSPFLSSGSHSAAGWTESPDDGTSLSAELQALRREKERLEATLKEQRDLIDAVMNHLPLGIAVNAVDPSVDFQYMNDRFPEIYGTTREILESGVDFFDAVYEDAAFRRRIRDRVLRDCHGGDVESMVWENVPLLRDGREWRYISARNIPLPSRGLMISVVTDVTEIKKSERNRRFFMELLENADDVAVMKDTRLRYVGVNRACLELLGLDDPSSVIGRTDEELFRGLATPQEIALFRDNDGQALGLPRGQSLVVEEKISGPDGIRTFLTRKFPIFDEKGEKLLGTGTLASEISERKRMEENLRVALRRAAELRDRAQAATEAKSTFLAMMSHEIRTPLNGLIGFLDLLSETDLDALQRSYLGYVDASARSLLELINNLLDISKIEAGALELESLTIDLAATVRQALAIAHYGARAKGIELRMKIADDVPPYIVTDPLRLHHVLVNLVGNGVKFTEKGFVEVAVTFREDGGRGLFSFSVSDTGIGIGAEQKRRLFKAFAQGDSSTARRYGGTGLGLAIAAGILERMGSSLELESRPGEGSRFSFTLAAEGTCGEPPETGGIARENLAVIERERPPIIVIADDIEPNRRLIGELLRTLLPGLTLFEAADGRKALEFFMKENPDLIVMDLKMPFLGGLEAAKHIRREESTSGRKRTPIVAITADTQAVTRRESLDSGIDAFLTKPVDGRKLRRLLERFLREP